MTLAEKIALLRRQKGWSQEELSDRLDISRQSVSKWESGASLPDLDKIVKLSRLFGVTTDFLLKEEEEGEGNSGRGFGEGAGSRSEYQGGSHPGYEAGSRSEYTGGSQPGYVGGSRSEYQGGSHPEYEEGNAPEGGAEPEYASGEAEAEVFWETGNAAEGTRTRQESEPLRQISREEAETYLELVRSVACRMGVGVMLCVLSPVALFLLPGLAIVTGQSRLEDLAAGAGLIILLLIVAVAVGILILNGMRLESWEFLEKELFFLEPGIREDVLRRKEEFQPAFQSCIVAGVVLCIFSVIPFLASGVLDASDGVTYCCLGLLLAIVSVAVYLFVWSGMIQESCKKLLQEGEYAAEKKRAHKKGDVLAGIYWCLVTAIYLAVSLSSMNWSKTWIIWPCAGLLYAALEGIWKLHSPS